MISIDCGNFHGRLRAICEGSDEEGVPLDMPVEKRLAYLQAFFPEADHESLLAHVQGTRLTQATDPKKVRGLGDLVAKAIKLASFGLITPCGGCRDRQERWNKITMGSLLPLIGIDKRAVTMGTPRNLCMHVWPTRNGAWRWAADQIMQRQHIFTGQRRIGIVEGPETESAAEVEAAFSGLGAEFFTMPNNPRIREGQTFQRLLEPLANDPYSITFYCHAKGARHGQAFSSDGNTIQRWTELMFWANLDRLPFAIEQLKTYAMTGAFRRFGQFKTPGNHAWHYSGSFYWFRNADVFERNWRRLDRLFFAVESWPGLMFAANQVACNFVDNCGDLYKRDFWLSTVNPELERLRNEDAARFTHAW